MCFCFLIVAPFRMSSAEVMKDDENLNPTPSPYSPPSKKNKTSNYNVDYTPHQVLTYEKAAVDTFISHFRSAIDRAEKEVTYWATLYEESQKEVSDLREKLRALEHKGEEADYLDPEGIPDEVGLRRTGRPSIGAKPAHADDPYDAPIASSSSLLAPNRWLSFSKVRGAVSAVSAVMRAQAEDDTHR